MIPKGLQSLLVDRIKRRAFSQLHRTVSGEVALLEMYLAAENLPGSDAIFVELEALAPEWLKGQLTRQGEDELRHAELIRARLVEVRGALRHEKAAARREQMALESMKVRQLKRLADTYGSEFTAGRIVPLLAMVLSLEQTAVRVMRRHVEVLERDATRGRGSARTARLLIGILEDEKRHVEECERAIGRLVPTREKLVLARLFDETSEIDRSFGVTGAVGMLALGWTLRGVDRIRGAARALEAAL